jgi:hypothetical protein
MEETNVTQKTVYQQLSEAIGLVDSDIVPDFLGCWQMRKKPEFCLQRRHPPRLRTGSTS